MKFQNPILNLKRFLSIKFSVTKFAKGDNSKNNFFNFSPGYLLLILYKRSKL